MIKKTITSLFCLSLILSASAYANEGDFTETNAVEVCTIPLPVTGSTLVNRAFLGTKHVYVRVGGKTYGTPFNAKYGYFGGDAYLYTDDILWERMPKGEVCYPVKRRVEDNDAAFAKRTKCIADKLARPTFKNMLKKDWYGVFDYHFLKNNCGSMAKYLVSCAGGSADIKFNFKIGSDVEATKPAKMVSTSSEGFQGRSEQSTYGDVCLRASTECEYEDIDQNI
jgi:hypothetical protein